MRSRNLDSPLDLASFATPHGAAVRIVAVAKILWSHLRGAVVVAAASSVAWTGLFGNNTAIATLRPA